MRTEPRGSTGGRSHVSTDVPGRGASGHAQWIDCLETGRG
jgi:hypothetical protein